ncbi:hypothetical protein M5K25_027098 [Dendrobium thyrsiflorum]|uniref:Uncharacterized protein n=1 Tax=Dendrobium thyrsiflorum TaxID=117978 RepID=A0ABD0TZ56_DENTH
MVKTVFPGLGSSITHVDFDGQQGWEGENQFSGRMGNRIASPRLLKLTPLDSHLAGKIKFQKEQVHVAILEVNLGVKFVATNAVRTPIMCGISSLEYDLVEIPGNALGEIAGEKAGIFKQRVPTYIVTQPEKAISVLKAKASQLGISLQVPLPVDRGLLHDQKHRLGSEVASAFADIVRSGVQANPISFIALLYRCSHLGFVEEIKRSLKYLVDAKFLIKFMTVKENKDIRKNLSSTSQVFDPRGMIIISTSISL